MPTWHCPAPSQIEPTTVTVAELAKFNNPRLIYEYVWNKNLSSFCINQTWWYLACTVTGCKKTVKSLPVDGYKCTGSTCTGTNGNPRYNTIAYHAC